MTSLPPRLAPYVAAWRAAADDVVALGRDLVETDFAAPTDLPGWSVHDVFAHLASIESGLAGLPQPQVEVPDLPHLRNAFGRWIERGVHARRDVAGADLVTELADAVERRAARLADDPPTDPGARAAAPAGQPWTWETLLANRVVDMWMHGQDIRRAVGRPGGLDGPGATVTRGVLASGLPYVLGKRVRPAPGTSVVWEVDGSPLSVGMGDDGRARAQPVTPADPTVRLRCDLETFVLLCGGRRDPATLPVEVEGDEELGRAVLAAMAITP